jgi:hypothetical protein
VRTSATAAEDRADDGVRQSIKPEAGQVLKEVEAGAKVQDSTAAPLTYLGGSTTPVPSRTSSSALAMASAIACWYAGS